MISFLFLLLLFELTLAAASKKDISPVPLPPPRRQSFHFSPTGTNPLDYDSIIALANDPSAGILTFTKNDKAVLKESYTLSSTSSYSYSESNANTVQQVSQSTAPNDISKLSALTSANAQARKVSSLKLTPVTIPDPPAHLNSHADDHSKTQTPGFPPPTSPPPQMGPIPSQPPSQTASLSVHLGAEDVKSRASLTSKPRVEKRASEQAQNQTQIPAPSEAEMTKPPPAIPPRPSPAELLVHN